MRDAAGEPADRFHIPRVTELLLETALLGDVLERHGQRAVGDWRERDVEDGRRDAGVAVREHVTDQPRRTVAQDRQRLRRQVRLHHRRESFRQPLAQELILGQIRQAQRRVVRCGKAEVRPAVGLFHVGDDQPDVHVAHRLRVQVAFFAGAPAIGDVVGDGQDGVDAIGPGAQRAGVAFGPALASLERDESENQRRAVTGDSLREQLMHGGKVVGVHESRQRRPQDLLERFRLEHRQSRGIHLEHPSREIDHLDAFGLAVEDGAQPFFTRAQLALDAKAILFACGRGV